MINEIYNNNIQALKGKEIYKDLYEGVKDKGTADDGVIIDTDLNGSKIIGLVRDENIYYLNSRYSDGELTDNWVKSFDNMNYQSRVIVFGASNFLAIKKLLSKLKDSNMVLVYEPDESIFNAVISDIDITEVINCDNVVMVVKNINDSCLQDFLINYISYAVLKYVQACCMWNYNDFYKEEYDEVIKHFYNTVDSIALNRNTLIMNSESMGENTISNFNDYINQYSINQIRQEFRNIENMEDIPAILVAAGPSLKKNIDDIKKAEGKAFIIAVDTAVKALLNHDIVPDMAVTVDGNKDPVLFAHSKYEDINMVVTIISNCNVMNMNNGKRFYFSNGNQYLDTIYAEEKNDIMYRTETGGSVANNAFSALNIFGFKKIILVGQDLAYPNNEAHIGDAYGKGGDDSLKDKELFEVEDIYGNIVLTEYNMDYYRKWFENQIIRYPELEVVDATEGGAKINGAVIMSLKEAIERYCDKKVNFKKILKNIKPMFDEETKEKLQKRLSNLSNELRDNKVKIETGIKNYDRLDMLNRKGKIHGKEFKNLIQKINKLSDEIIKEPVMDIVSIYNQIEEYQVLGEVFDQKDNVYEDISYVVSSGKKMLNSYLRGIDKTIKIIDKINNVSNEQINEALDKIMVHSDELKDACKINDEAKVNQSLKLFYNDIASAITLLKRYSQNKEDRRIQVLYGNILNSMKRVEIFTEEKRYEELLRSMELKEIGYFDKL